ncbi:MAG: hypothetical protein NC489_44505 [Ruminococcus flavefaciens]|nr:hypothetical protein [Ruminococcus flavefaciens]
MKNPKIQTVLKKLTAVTMAFAILGGSVIVPKAEEIQASGEETEASARSFYDTVIAAIFPDGPNSRTIKPYNNNDVIIVITASCTGTNLVRKCEWGAELSGSLSDAYPGSYYSYGYGGSTTNQKAKTEFTRYDKSDSASAIKGSSCANAMTKAYYHNN